jgi:hypothetical protein
MMIVNNDLKPSSTGVENGHRLDFVEDSQKNPLQEAGKTNRKSEYAGLPPFNSEAFGAKTSAGLPSGHFETKEIIMVAGIVVTIFVTVLTRRFKCKDDVNAIVINDVNAFLSKIEELSGCIKSHQSGYPCAGRDLRESREYLTKLKREAVNNLNRITNAIESKKESDSFKAEFRLWKKSTEDNSGWITDKKKRWPTDRIEELDESNREYIGKITKLRQRIAKREVKL